MLLEQPLDLIKLSLDTAVQVRLKGGRQVVGKLHAFDAHMNVVLGDAQETRLQSDDGDPKQRSFPMLFIRGDSIVLVAPIK